MKQCHDCGREVPEGLHFCPDCGAPLDEIEDMQPVEPAQALSLAEMLPAASNAGGEGDRPEGNARRGERPEKTARRAGEKAARASRKRKNSAPSEKKAGKNRRARLRRLAVLAVAAVAIVAAAVLVVKNTLLAQRQAPIVYSAAQSVRFSDGSADGAQQFAQFAQEGALPDAVFAEQKPEKMAVAGPGGTGLVWVDAENAGGAISVAGETIRAFGVSPQGDAVWYIDEQGALVLHDLTRKRQLAAGVADCLFDDGFNTCAYLTQTGELYVTRLGEKADKVLVESEASGLSAFRGNVLVYTLDRGGQSDLVFYQVRRQTKTVFENSVLCAAVQGTDGFYIEKRTDEPVVKTADPQAGSDALWLVEEGSTTEYGYPAGQWYYWYSFYLEQGRASVEGTDSAMTLEEYELYSARQAARVLLEAYAGGSRSELLFWNGKKAEVIATGVREVAAADSLRKDDKLFVSLCTDPSPVDVDALAQTLVGQVKAMERLVDGERRVELTWLGDEPAAAEAQAREAVQRAVTGFTSYALVSGKKLTETGVDDAAIARDLGTADFDVFAAPDGETLYLVTAQDGACTLRAMAAQAGSVVRELQRGVGVWEALSWGALSAQSPEGGAGTLFVDDSKLDSAVLLSSVRAARDEATVWYLKNYNGVSGELYRWQNGKSVLIASGVHEFRLIGDGRLLFLQDFMSGMDAGELYYARGRRDPVKLDTGVNRILTPPDERHYLVFWEG